MSILLSSRRALLLAALLCSSRPTLASSPYFVTKLAAAEQSAGRVAPGDLLDWTLLVTQHGLVGECRAAQVLLAPGHDLVTAGEGGFLDPLTGAVRWTATTTPALARMVEDATVELHFTTRVRALDGDGRVCARAELDLPPGTDCSGRPPCPSDDPATPGYDSTCLPTPEPLAVTSFSPCRGTAAGGDEVEVLGSGFDSYTRLVVGGTEAETLSLDGTRLLARTPSVAGGMHEVRVRSEHHEAAHPDPFLAAYSGAAANSLRLVYGLELRLYFEGRGTTEVSPDPLFSCPGTWAVNGVSPVLLDDPPPWIPLWFYRVD